jgi:hypothetical protein
VPATRRRRRGYIEQLPSGSWRAVVFVGSDPLNGRPRSLRESATRYAAAEVALTKLQRQVDEDQHPKTKITVRQAVEQWLDVADIQDTTRDRYEDLIRLYILPTFGDTLAAKLDNDCSNGFTHGCSAAVSSAGGAVAAGTSASRSAAAPSARSTSS